MIGVRYSNLPWRVVLLSSSVRLALFSVAYVPGATLFLVHLWRVWCIWSSSFLLLVFPVCSLFPRGAFPLVSFSFRRPPPRRWQTPNSARLCRHMPSTRSHVLCSPHDWSYILDKTSLQHFVQTTYTKARIRKPFAFASSVLSTALGGVLSRKVFPQSGRWQHATLCMPRHPRLVGPFLRKAGQRRRQELRRENPGRRRQE